MSIERNLRLALHQLVGAIEYTPMGVRGIKAMANARKALEAAQQPATAIACGMPGMAKTTCPYCEQGFTFEHEQPATGEPVQATPNFTQLMQILDGLNRCHSRDSKVEFLRSWIRDWTQHKVDKLTHPAPSAPATPEPVLFIHPDTFAMNNAQVGAWKPGHELTSYIPLYTHPAQNVPDDSKRLDYLQDRGATIDLIAGVADFYPMQFRVGGLHSSANIDVRAAIDAAMLAAKKEIP